VLTPDSTNGVLPEAIQVLATNTYRSPHPRQCNIYMSDIRMVLTNRRQPTTQGNDSSAPSSPSAQHHHHAPTLQHAAQEVAAEIKKHQQQQQNGTKGPAKTPIWVYALLFAFAILTYVTKPVPFHPAHGQAPTIQHVFYYGWLTAMSTGCGALPFFLFPDVASFWVGISNGTLLSLLLTVCG
jgi:hypothetical protein